MSRTIAIGDVHGCSEALRALIGAMSLAADDTLIPLGDYVDRGPDSRGVLEQLLELEGRCHFIPLIGNHELMLLGVLDGTIDAQMWQYYGGAETLASYGGRLSAISDRHLEFLDRCYRFAETDTHFFVHANYDSNLDLDEQPENLLLWTHLSTMRPTPHKSGKIAVVGHTPQFDNRILDLGHLICVDTCCFANGWLTALDVTTGEVWQATERGTTRTGALG